MIAYLLLRMRVTHDEAIGKVSEVLGTEVERLIGPYQAIAKLEVEDNAELVNKDLEVKKLEFVNRTEALISTESQ